MANSRLGIRDISIWRPKKEADIIKAFAKLKVNNPKNNAVLTKLEAELIGVYRSMGAESTKNDFIEWRRYLSGNKLMEGPTFSEIVKRGDELRQQLLSSAKEQGYDRLTHLSGYDIRFTKNIENNDLTALGTSLANLFGHTFSVEEKTNVVYTVPIDGKEKIKPLIQYKAAKREVSPDGKSFVLTYISSSANSRSGKNSRIILQNAAKVLKEMYPNSLKEEKIPSKEIYLKNLSNSDKNKSVQEFRSTKQAILRAKEEGGNAWFWAEPKGKTVDKKKAVEITNLSGPTDPLQVYNAILNGNAKDVVRKGPVVSLSTVNAVKDAYSLHKLGFGTSMQDAEKEFHTHRIGEALNDLAMAWGISADRIGKQRLSFEVGSRGKGRQKAAYFPSTRTINLTRNNGIGSLAHEYAHFLDDIIYSGHDGAYKDMVTSFRHGEDKDSIATTFSKFMQALKVDETITLEKAIARKADQVATMEDRCQLLLDVIGDKYDPKVKKALSEVTGAKRYLERLKSGRIPKEEYQASDFYFHSQELGAKYWASNAELFARAVACAIHDDLESKGIINTYLAPALEDKALIAMNAQFYAPTGEHRKQVLEAFRKFRDALNSQGAIAKALRQASRPIFILRK